MSTQLVRTDPRFAPTASLLALVMAVGPFVHYGVSALGPFIVVDIGMSRTAFGNLWLVTFAAAGVGSMISGVLTDRFGPRPLLVGVFGLAMSAMLIAGSATTYIVLMAALAISGIAQSASNPVTNLLVAKWADPTSKGYLLGVKQSGVQISQFLAGASLPFVAATVGWRPSLLIAAVPAGLGLALVLRPRALAWAGPRPARRTLPKGAIDPSWWLLTAFTMAIGVVTQMTNVYLPLYGFEEIGLSAAVAGSSAAVLGGLGVVSRLLWGRLVINPRSLKRACLAVPIISAVATLCILLAGHGLPAAFYWVGAALFAFSALGSNVLVVSWIVRRVEQDSVGRASSLMATGLYVGFMIGPILFGGVVDATSYTAGWLTSMAVHLVALIIAIGWLRRTD